VAGAICKNSTSLKRVKLFHGRARVLNNRFDGLTFDDASSVARDDGNPAIGVTYPDFMAAATLAEKAEADFADFGG
jgi:hypothetical protein